MNLVHSAAEVFRLLFEPSVHSSPSCFIHSFLDHKHRQHGTRERKEFHFQSVFQVLRLVLGITPKAVLFQPLKQPNEMGRDFSTGLRKLRLGEGEAPRAESLGFHPKRSLFLLPQPSVSGMLAKVILGEMLLDLEDYNLY